MKLVLVAPALPCYKGQLNDGGVGGQPPIQAAQLINSYPYSRDPRVFSPTGQNWAAFHIEKNEKKKYCKRKYFKRKTGEKLTQKGGTFNAEK